MSTCLHDPEEYGDPCELCALSKHPARKAMAAALYTEQYGDSHEFVGERMDLCDETVDLMLTAAAQVGWTLSHPSEEKSADDNTDSS